MNWWKKSGWGFGDQQLLVLHKYKENNIHNFKRKSFTWNIYWQHHRVIALQKQRLVLFLPHWRWAFKAPSVMLATVWFTCLLLGSHFFIFLQYLQVASAYQTLVVLLLKSLYRCSVTTLMQQHCIYFQLWAIAFGTLHDGGLSQSKCRHLLLLFGTVLLKQ